MNLVLAIALMTQLLPPGEGRWYWHDEGRWVVRAYCPCRICCSAQNGLTANGEIPHVGGVATDRITKRGKIVGDMVPMGTFIRIEGINQLLKVNDRRRSSNRKRLDIFMESHRDGEIFGRQTLRVWTKKRRDNLGVNEAIDSIGSAVGKTVEHIVGE